MDDKAVPDMFVDFQLDDPSTNAISAKKLKTILKESFDKSGALISIKAQLRQQFIQGLMKINKKQRGSSNQDRDENMDIHEKIILSTIFHFLKNREMSNTMSVYIAETGLDADQAMLTELDVARMFRFDALTQAFLDVTLYAHQKGESTDSPEISLLELMFQYCLVLHKDQRKEVAIQATENGPSPREILDSELLQLEKTYQAKIAFSSTGPAKCMEERLIAYQKDCELRKMREVEVQISYFKEQETQRIRFEEASKSRRALEALRKELEFDYTQRLQAHIDRENNYMLKLTEQERRLQQTLYDSRQVMQREIDELRNREQMALRKVELESQGLKMLELRLKEAQGVLESREKEVARMEKEFESKRTNVLEAVRKEVRDQLRQDLEALSIDRVTLAAERSRFNEEKVAHAGIIEGARALRDELNRSLELGIAKDQEIAALQRHQLQLKAQLDAEEQHVAQLLANIDPELAQYSRLEQILQLIQRNADLEVKMSKLQDAGQLYEMLEEINLEMKTLQKRYDEAMEQIAKERGRFQSDLERLQSDKMAEKAKVVARDHKIEELQCSSSSGRSPTRSTAS